MTNSTKSVSAQDTISSASWQLMAAAAFAIRVVIGWVYWGGFSRRFIYHPSKIDPASHGYLANKLVHAAPGMPFGINNIVYWVLDQGALLHVAVICFSLVELAVGVGLIFGLFTRLMSLVGLGLSVTLMVLFGWMGTTCLDEWTMAAYSFAIVSVTLVTGGGLISIDNLMVKSGLTQRHRWLGWVTSGPLPLSKHCVINLSKTLGLLSIAFTVFFYGYNFNAIYSPLHKRINNLVPRITLTDATLGAGQLSVHTYMDRGPDTQGAYIVRAILAAKTDTAAPLFDYDAAALNNKALVKITKNQFAPWSTCQHISYGIRCQLGSKATLNFTVPAGASTTGHLVLTLTDVEGRTSTVPVHVK